MTEPASGAVGAIAAWKLGVLHKVLALFGIGALGAWLIAIADPTPESATRKERARIFFLQSLAAGVMALLFTVPAMRFLGSMFEWAKPTPGDPESWLTTALPIGFLIGALSWGLVGALVKLRQLLNERGAKAIGERVGLRD
jgi:hypothetical protein